MNEGTLNFDLRKNKELVEILLKDQTTKKNILWATDDYSSLSPNLKANKEMNIHWVTNNDYELILPRVLKNKDIKEKRTKDRAEVFTPANIINEQVGLIEKEMRALSLEDYVKTKWIEIACGEAPYVTTRYDVVTGESIKINERVGFLDRKIQRINREIISEEEWYRYIVDSYKAIYAYEYHGDSLFVARENLLLTFIENYIYRFKKDVPLKKLVEIATIISFNVFQMDGLSYEIPFTHETSRQDKQVQLSLFQTAIEQQLEMDIKLPDTGIKRNIKVWDLDTKVKFEQLRKGDEILKFDVVIGNPPYQESDNSTRDDGTVSASASPLYHLFVEEASKIGTKQSLIIPARWLSGGGKGLGTFSRKMLKDNKFKQFNYYPNSKDIFPNNDIKGGICFYVRDNKYVGKSNLRIYHSNKFEESIRYLDGNNLGFFIPYKEMDIILEKVRTHTDLNKNNIQLMVSGRNPYGLSTDFFKNNEKYGVNKLSKTSKGQMDIKVYGLLDGKRVERYISKEDIQNKGKKTIYKYKVFLPYAYGSGDFGEKTSEMILGLPGEICTETFLRMGEFSSQKEAENLIKYIKTKFFRSLVGILKTTQHATNKFSLVPMQNFKNNSDIDWNTSITEIDQQLFDKYGLNDEEKKFILENVLEME